MNQERLTDDVTWIYECHNEDERHLHASQYLISSNGSGVLIDAGMGDVDKLVKIVEEICPDGLNAVILAHSILPHTKNIHDLLAQWEELTIITSTAVPQLIGLDNATPRSTHKKDEIGGEMFTFLDPLLTDVVNSSWIYHHGSKILFTAEGVGHYHHPGACGAISEMMERHFEFHDVHSFHKNKFTYLKYVDAEKLRKAFDIIFNKWDVRTLAPLHGTPIHEGDIDTYLENVVKSITDLATAEV